MNPIHFNNAGSSLNNLKTIKEIKKYLELESVLGGYETQELFSEKLIKFYRNIGKLINCDSNEISFMPNSTLAWNFAFNSVPLKKNQNIVIFENEYTSNHLSILKKKKEFNEIKIVKLDKNGLIDLDDFKNKIDNKTKIVSINHICSQNGNVMPVEIVGNILKEENQDSIYIVDGCQSAGQIPINVKKIKCDFFTSTGRKFLNGPRGTGFLYINPKIKKKLNPIFIDMTSSKLISENSYKNIKSKHIMETFEHSPALKVGLSDAVENLLKIGIKKIKNKNIALSRYLREKLSKNNNIIFYENDASLSAINTFDLRRGNINDLYNYLKEKKVNTYISNESSSYLYFKRIKKKNILRVSFHYYNNKKEIDYFVKLIDSYHR